MNQVQTNKAMLFGLAASVVGISGCKKYPDGPAFSLKSKKARLVGEWEMLDAPYDFGDVEILFEFEQDGDFIGTQTYSYAYPGYSYSYSYSFEGEWAFSSDMEELDIDINNDERTFEILRLTNKELFLEDSYDDHYEFKKQE